jgi:hypothetical protein
MTRPGPGPVLFYTIATHNLTDGLVLLFRNGFCCTSFGRETQRPGCLCCVFLLHMRWNHIWFRWFVSLRAFCGRPFVDCSINPALKPVLVSEGVYADLCDNEGHSTNQVTPCKDQVRIKSTLYFLSVAEIVVILQDIRLNLMFTIATVVTNVRHVAIIYRSEY